MSKHTPGPWAKEGIQWYGNDGVMVVMSDGPSFGSASSFPNAEANARLIAAAPDLLDALECLLETYSKPDQGLCCSGRDCGCMGATIYDQAEHYAREAIAKARGEA